MIQLMTPVQIKEFSNVKHVEELLNEKPACVSFQDEHVAVFASKGSYVVIDFGKEVCGNLRFVTRAVLEGTAQFRITFGESLTEAYSSLGEKNATNDHASRDFVVDVPNMSDLTFGSSGFRFARVELLTDSEVWIQNIFAMNVLPDFKREASITTSDEQLNKIIDTAIYTLKLNLQNGYMWDGIKRDRLVWCGDLHQEIVTSLYLFGDNSNITNSLSFLKSTSPVDKWMNWIPTYSAWWVLNLCDYYRISGNELYFKENVSYAEAILEKLDACISNKGKMDFNEEECAIEFFLDWPTCKTEDAIIGTASLLVYVAKAFLLIQDNANCHSIIQKLSGYLERPCEFKQTRAFQILTGRSLNEEQEFLENEGARGFSTFMAYYILTADALAGGENMLTIIKEYYGAMLSRGATTFWEDFHMDWLDGSGRIDELPTEGQKDIHGDYGAFCYEGFRHSLCHGWASGVVAFVIEYMLGLKVKNGGEVYEVTPHTMGVQNMEAKIPVKNGWLHIIVRDGKLLMVEKENCL